MSTIAALLTRVQSLNINKIAVESLKETSTERETLNLEQMNQGYRSDGSEILPTYSDYTIFVKKLKGQPFDRVTLYDTGAFYAGLRSDVTSKVIITDSTDPKTTKLKKKYETAKGKLFGLGKEFKEEYIERDLRPKFNGKIEAVTGLKLK